jgi:TP901 family phage tail tape measure protein
MSDYNVSVEMELIVEQFNKAAQTAQKQIKDLTGKEKQLGDEAIKSTGKLNQEERAIKNVGKQADITSKKVGLMGKMFGGIKGQLMGFVGVLGGAFAIKKVVNDLADLSFMLAKIQTNTHASTTEMNSLKEAMIKLAPTTEFSVGDLMHTAFTKSKTQSITKILEDMQHISNLATSIGYDLESANLATLQVQNTFDDRKIVDVVNSITRSYDGSTQSLHEYTEAMRVGGAVAKNYGFSLEQISAMIGALAKQTVTGSNAGQAIRTFTTSLSGMQDIKKGKKGAMLTDPQKALLSIGIKPGEVDPSKVPLVDIINKLSTAMSKLDETQKNVMMGKLFGNNQSTNALALLLKNPQDLADALSKQMNIKMTAEGGAKNIMSQLGGQVKGLGGDIAGLVYALEPLTPIILDIVSVFRILLQSINKIIGFIAKPLGLGYSAITTPDAKGVEKFKNDLSKMQTTQPKTLNETFSNVPEKLSKLGGGMISNIGNSFDFIKKDIMQNISNAKQENKITVVLESKTPNFMATVIESNTQNSGNVEVQKRNFINS